MAPQIDLGDLTQGLAFPHGCLGDFIPGGGLQAIAFYRRAMDTTAFLSSPRVFPGGCALKARVQVAHTIFSPKPAQALSPCATPSIGVGNVSAPAMDCHADRWQTFWVPSTATCAILLPVAHEHFTDHGDDPASSPPRTGGIGVPLDEGSADRLVEGLPPL